MHTRIPAALTAFSMSAVFLLTGCSSLPPSKPSLQQIQTVVVIYAENRSFDHLFGHFPGAEGLDNATAEQKTQLDRDGKPFAVLPPVFTNGKLLEDYPRNLPNGPFAADLPPVQRTLAEMTPNPIHNFYHHQAQVNGGKNNQFVAHTTVGAWTMATYDGSKLRLWQWAREFTIADHFFQGTFGGSFINHHWLVCACVPQQPEAPGSARAQLDENGRLKVKEDSPKTVMEGPPKFFDGRVAPVANGSYVVNSADAPYQPSRYGPPVGGDPAYADPAQYPLRPQTAKTIGDTLTAKGVSWAWYAQGWNAALADGMRDPAAKRTVIYTGANDALNFQAHHQPLNYYARFAPGTPDRGLHLRDRDDFIEAIAKGTLPQVSFYKPAGRNNQHSASSTIAAGDADMHEILTRLRASPQWAKMAIIVTYDEYGGYWDHVPPPSGPGWGDYFGPGTRIPAVIVSPFARRGYVDKAIYDSTSIQKFLNARFGLEPLPGLREKMGDLTGAFRAE